LISSGKQDSTILNVTYWQRPSYEEMVMWYVIREIHYNSSNEKKKPRPNIDIAKEVLSSKIDERWLLDNYYYRSHSGLGMYFNSADLSHFNFNLDSFGLQNKTEKAICFLNIMEACAQRFKILAMFKSHALILQFAAKMPKINGADYFNYKDFDYEDFKWIGYDKVVKYNEWHVGDYYDVLIAQMVATDEIRGKKQGQTVYYNSILSEPNFFKYSKAKDFLQKLNAKMKK
jgi:hypothetical protein